MAGEQTLPIRWDLTGEDAIVQGADWRREMLLTSDAGIWNTAGYTGRMKIRATYDGPVLLECTTANGRIEVGIQGTAPYQRNVAITLTAATTAALSDFGRGVWDIELVSGTGQVSRLYGGYVTLNREATY